MQRLMKALTIVKNLEKLAELQVAQSFFEDDEPMLKIINNKISAIESRLQKAGVSIPN